MITFTLSLFQNYLLNLNSTNESTLLIVENTWLVDNMHMYVRDDHEKYKNFTVTPVTHE